MLALCIAEASESRAKDRMHHKVNLGIVKYQSKQLDRIRYSMYLYRYST